MFLAFVFRTFTMHINQIAYPIGPKKIHQSIEYTSSMVFNLPG